MRGCAQGVRASGPCNATDDSGAGHKKQIRAPAAASRAQAAAASPGLLRREQHGSGTGGDWGPFRAEANLRIGPMRGWPGWRAGRRLGAAASAEPQGVAGDGAGQCAHARPPARKGLFSGSSSFSCGGRRAKRRRRRQPGLQTCEERFLVVKCMLPWPGDVAAPLWHGSARGACRLRPLRVSPPRPRAGIPVYHISTCVWARGRLLRV